MVTCWMGEEQVGEARKLFQGAAIPTFRTPEPAVDLFAHVSNYYRNRQLLMQSPPSISEQAPPRLESARLVIETALMEGRKVLNEMESKAVLAAFRVPIAQTVVARSASEAMVLAEELGLPVVMKIDSPQIVHKADSGGVRLNLNSLAAVRDSWLEIMDEVKKNRPDAQINGIAIEPMIQKPNGRELVVGMVRDKIFGPTIVFGPGGAGVETHISDRAVALPPLNPVLVADMLASTRTTARLGEFRNMPPVNMQAIETVLLNVSAMVCELPWISEMDINPLIVDENTRLPSTPGSPSTTCRSPPVATTTWRSIPTPRTCRPAIRPRTAPRSRSDRSRPRTCASSRTSCATSRPSRATCAS
jgi:acetyltransferase